MGGNEKRAPSSSDMSMVLQHYEIEMPAAATSATIREVYDMLMTLKQNQIDVPKKSTVAHIRASHDKLCAQVFGLKNRQQQNKTAAADTTPKQQQQIIADPNQNAVSNAPTVSTQTQTAASAPTIVSAPNQTAATAPNAVNILPSSSTTTAGLPLTMPSVTTPAVSTPVNTTTVSTPVSTPAVSAQNAAIVSTAATIPLFPTAATVSNNAAVTNTTELIGDRPPICSTAVYDSATGNSFDIDQTDARLNILRKQRELLLLQREVMELQRAMQPAFSPVIEHFQPLNFAAAPIAPAVPVAPAAPIASVVSVAPAAFAPIRMDMTAIEAMVSQFSGDDTYDVYKWMNDLDDAFGILQFDNQTKFIAMRRLLSGTAKLFVRTVAAVNYDELRDALIDEFGRRYSNDEVYIQLRSRRLKPTETVHRYVIEMQEIASRANIPEHELIDIILAGIGDTSTSAAMLYGATTLRDLKTLVVRYERLRASASATAAIRRSMSSNLSTAAKPNTNNAVRNNAMPAAAATDATNDTSIRCFNCSRFGHYQSACPKPKRPENSCFRCGKLDHVYKNCPNRPAALTSTAFQRTNVNTAAGAIENMNELTEELNALQTVSVALGYSDFKYAKFQSVLCLFDSGSPRCFVKRALTPNLRETKLFKLPYSLGNKPLMSYGKIKFAIKLSNKLIQHNVYIVPDDAIFVPMIIGRDFLNKANIKMISVKRCYTFDELERFQSNNKSINEKLKEKLESLGILKSSISTVCDSIPIENKNYGNNLTTLGHNTHSENIFDCFNALCAIDTTSDTDGDFCINKSLKPDQLHSLRSAITDAYYSTKIDPSVTNDYCMRIEVTQNTPIYRRPRRLSHQERTEVREIVDDLLSRNVIRHSNSPYASAIVPVRKRNGELRKCVDYRPLNKITHRDNHPLPLPDDCLEHLGNKKFFTIMDLKNGFNQIKIHEDSIKYTAFVTTDGQYEYLKMPYGLKNGPAVFQRFLNFLLKELITAGLAVVFMDDILIASPDFESHLRTVCDVVKILRSAGLELNLEKCKFGQSEIEYLGYRANAQGIVPSDRHIEAIQNYPMPRTYVQLKSCLGLFSFFRRFVPSYSKIAHPLSQLMKKDAPFVFTEECRQAFFTLRQKLLEPPVLSIFDVKRETELHCDASAKGFGAALMQKQDDGKFHPVAFFSKSTSPAESRLHSYELETLAVIYALRRFHTYFDCRPFKIVTDCDALARTLANENGSSKIARWALMLEQYNYSIQHRPGKSMSHVDALSRIEHIGAVSELDIDFQLRIAQSRDPVICRLKSELETSENKKFELVDEVVFQVAPLGNRRLYVPREMINNVIRWTHEKIGHLGEEKCCNEIKKHYWFPLMKTRVHNFIRNCLKCIVYSAPARTNKRNLFNIPKTPLPFDTIHIDHLGPLPSITSKKKHILLIIDAFTKFTKLYATNTTNTKESCTALQQYFDQYSRPRCVISDRGTAFSSNECQEFLKARNIKHIMNATASPQANGQVERVNRILTPLMAKSCEKFRHVDWPSTLRKAEFVLNNTVHTTTKQIPSVLLFGIAQRGEIIDELAEFLDERVNAVDRNLENLRNLASQNIIKSQEANLNQFLKRNTPAETFEKGDYVAIKHKCTTPGVNKKLEPKFRGPYVVDAVLPHDRYVVSDVEGCQITQIPYRGILDASKLRKWVSNSADLVDDECPEETLTDSE